MTASGIEPQALEVGGQCSHHLATETPHVHFVLKIQRTFSSNEKIYHFQGTHNLIENIMNVFLYILEIFIFLCNHF